MMKRTILALGFLALAACAQDPGTKEVQVQQQIEREQSQRLTQNQNNKELNWIHIGVSTGKYSESLTTGVFRTYNECVRAAAEETNTCVPTAALPESYWQ